MSGGTEVGYTAKDFLEGVLLLDPWEELAYRRICDLIYETGDQVKNDDCELRKFSRVGNRWKRVKAKLIEFGKLFIEDDRITNRRCKTELAKKVGQKVAQKVHEKVPENVGLFAPLSCPPSPSPAPLTTTPPLIPPKNNSRIAARRSAPASLSESDFEVFWKVCPRKIGKGAAIRAYRKARCTVPAETLLAGMKRFAASKNGTDPQFIAHPATWLNQQRWLDEESESVEYQLDRPTGPPPRPEDLWPDDGRRAVGMA